MTDPELFEYLKARLVDSYLDYIQHIINVSYEDISDINKRSSLVESYCRAVQENARYRMYISNITTTYRDIKKNA